jgi:hypothetical protein
MYQLHMRDDEFAVRGTELLHEASDFMLTVLITQFDKELLELAQGSSTCWCRHAIL